MHERVSGSNSGHREFFSKINYFLLNKMNQYQTLVSLIQFIYYKKRQQNNNRNYKLKQENKRITIKMYILLYIALCVIIYTYR